VAWVAACRKFECPLLRKACKRSDGRQFAATVVVVPNGRVDVEVEGGVHGAAFEYGKAGD